MCGFSASLHRNFHHNAEKIFVNSYLIKLITFTCTDLSPKKACEATKEKKDVVSNWSHLNLHCHNFDVHLSNTVVAVDLLVVVADAAVVVLVIVCVGKDIQE